MLKMGSTQATLRIATTTASIHASFTRTIALRGVITTKIAKEKSLSMKSLHCVPQCVSSALLFCSTSFLARQLNCVCNLPTFYSDEAEKEAAIRVSNCNLASGLKSTVWTVLIFLAL